MISLSLGNQPDVIEQQLVFMSRSKAKAILRKEKEKASVSYDYLDLQPPYSAEVSIRPYPMGQVVPRSRSLISVVATPESMSCALLEILLRFLVLCYSYDMKCEN